MGSRLLLLFRPRNLSESRMTRIFDVSYTRDPFLIKITSFVKTFGREDLAPTRIKKSPLSRGKNDPQDRKLFLSLKGKLKKEPGIGAIRGTCRTNTTNPLNPPSQGDKRTACGNRKDGLGDPTPTRVCGMVHE